MSQPSKRMIQPLYFMYEYKLVVVCCWFLTLCYSAPLVRPSLSLSFSPLSLYSSYCFTWDQGREIVSAVFPILSFLHKYTNLKTSVHTCPQFSLLSYANLPTPNPLSGYQCPNTTANEKNGGWQGCCRWVEPRCLSRGRF